MITFTNNSDGKCVQCILRQVGWSWRLVDMKCHEDICMTETERVFIGEDEEGHSIFPSVILPSPPIPTDQLTWDRMVRDYRQSGNKGRGRVFDTSLKGKPLTKKQSEYNAILDLHEKRVNKEWLKDMTEVWKKVNKGQVPPIWKGEGEPRHGKIREREWERLELTLTDLLDHMDVERLKRWGITGTDLDRQDFLIHRKTYEEYMLDRMKYDQDLDLDTLREYQKEFTRHREEEKRMEERVKRLMEPSLNL